jgi:ABC-type transporter Mla subunit MlaD
MTNTPTYQPANSDLMERLTDAAECVATVDNASADRLRSLADAIRTRATERWAGIDLTRIVDIPAISEAYTGRGGLIRLGIRGTGWITFALEMLRSGLILVPIILTWDAIRQAVVSYQNLLADQPLKTQESFFVLWQRSFDGYGSGSLATVAQEVATVIGIVVALTILVIAIDRLSKEWQAREGGKLRSSLNAVLVDATLELAKQKVEPSNFASHFEEAVRDLATSLKEAIGELTTSLNNELKGVTALTEKTRTTFTEEMAQIKETSRSNRAAAHDLAAFTTQLKQAGDSINAASGSMAQAANAVNTRVGALEEHVGRLTQVQADMVSAMRDMSQTLAALAANERAMSEKQAASIETFTTELHTTLSEVVTNVRAAANGINVAATQVRQSGGDMNKAAANFNVAQEQLKQVVEALAREHVSQGRIVDSINRTAATMSDTLAKANALSQSLGQLPAQFDAIASSMKVIPAALNQTIVNVTRDQSAASANISTASQSLAAVSRNLDDAARHLDVSIQRMTSATRTAAPAAPRPDGRV